MAGAGGGSSVEALSGMEKSSISLLRTMPVDGERNLAPKYPFMVLVIDTAFLSVSTIDKWIEPWYRFQLHIVGNKGSARETF